MEKEQNNRSNFKEWILKPVANIQYAMGYIYYTGKNGIEKDINKAKQYALKAAKKDMRKPNCK